MADGPYELRLGDGTSHSELTDSELTTLPNRRIALETSVNVRIVCGSCNNNTDISQFLLQHFDHEELRFAEENKI